MKKFVLIVVSFFLFNASPAMADHHGYIQKDLLENDRVRVQRKYEDGSTMLFTYKTGDIVFADKPEDKQKYSVKNMGKSTIVLQVTFVK
jgi:ABC-type oligopeptide transport system substrate-binding subunit